MERRPRCYGPDVAIVSGDTNRWTPRASYEGREVVMKIGLWIVGALAALVAVFYAFNAYIQFRERGFAEAMDLPIAIVAALLAIGAFWRARRTV